MFKPTQSMLARGRLRLTTKQVNGGYYKGNRTGSMGGWDKRGTYKPDFSKHRVYMAPEKLEVPGKYYPEDQRKEPFLLAPFITKHMRQTPSNYVQDIERNGRKSTVIRGFQGTDYLQMWADTPEAEEARSTQPKPEKIETVPTAQLEQIEQQKLPTKPTRKAPHPEPETKTKKSKKPLSARLF
ncbi:unnamed protein product [Penicillium salamii]|nr:unnamed protein product [Penicillium salamii]CAG8351793.1 unnamed protein product [Penicillium salamii]